MDSIFQIARVTPETDAGVQDVLKASRLMPLNTAAESPSPRTLALAAVQDAGTEVVGCAAVEVYGTDGLLRSVAVRPELRGQHLGQYLVAAAEAESVEAGIEALYLLTETAESFFDHLGYERVERGQVPEAVLASDQFAKLCPSSAVAMRRSLQSD